MPTLFEIFWIFLKLGCSSFGGPAAHLVYFKQAFVEKKHWLNEQQYAQLLALTQLLPGPSSSQMGMAIGYLQHRHLGAIVAWIGFTLPSALLMFGLARFIQQHPVFNLALFSTIHSIILAIIVFAFLQMFKSYCKTKLHFALMLVSTGLLLLFSNAWIQLVIILGTGCLAVLMTRFAYIQKDSNDLAIEKQHINFNTLPTAHRHHSIWLIGFISIFFALCLAMLFSNKLFFQASFSFYKTGALVFGGGHVVLPMLHQDLVNTGLISKQDFELGYTLAQFMPGPLFSFASYLGAYLPLTAFPIVNAAITTLFIFLPSFFFVFLALPYWSKQLENRYIENSVMLINAAVVGFILSVIIPMLQKIMGSPLDILTTCLMLLSLKLKISIFISIPSLLFIHYALLNFI